METKIPEITKPMASMMSPGMSGELTGLSARAYFMMIKLVTVEKTAIPNLAINMNTSENPSTNANLALFLRSKMKAFKADEQKLSPEMAM